MRYFVFILLLISFLSCENKNSVKAVKGKTPAGFKLTGTIKGYATNPFYLYGFQGFESFTVDSGLTNDAGEFDLTFPSDLPVGLYRLVIKSPGQVNRQQEEKYLDFVFNNENIVFTTSARFLIDSLKILSSKENKELYEYLKKRELNIQKMRVLNQFLFHYPEKDNFHRKISRQVRKQRNRNSNFTENLIKKNEKLMVSRIIKIHKTPRIAENLPDNEINKYIKDNFFCYTDFADTFLLRTPYLPEKVLNYITLFRNENLNEEEQEDEYIRAIDTVMKKAAINEKVFFMIAEYMVDGFESLGIHTVSDYIVSQFLLGGQCDRKDIPESLLAKASEINKLATGMPAPDFIFNTLNGKSLSLYGLHKDYTLIVFWGSWCPYCNNMLIKLKSLYDKYLDKNPGYFDILAVGIENEEKPWKDFIRQENLNFIHTSEIKSWEEKSAKLFHVDATPMLFLLDKNKNIVLKPTRVRTLERHLQNNLK